MNRPKKDKSSSPVPRDEVTADPLSDSLAVPAGTFTELESARQRSVRLVISIPVLTLLIVLSSGTIFYVSLMNLAEQPGLALNVRDNLERAALIILLSSIGISFLSGVIGYILARQIVRPIKQLAGRMEALASGDFSVISEPIHLGEFGQLGTSFNRMVEQLNRTFQERDRQLRESFGGAHILVDQTGLVLEADHAVRRVLGIMPGELLGRNVLQPDAKISIIDRNPRFLESLGDLIDQCVAGHPYRRALPIRDEEGRSSMRYFVSGIMLESSNISDQRILVEVRDISGIAGFYEQMQRADRLAAVGTLATGIAHEIRNPLASIRGMIQLMSEFDDKQPGGNGGQGSESEYFRRIIREVDRLEKLVDGIMNFAGTDDAPAEDVDINNLLLDVAEVARHHAGDSSHKIEIVWDLDTSLPTAFLQSSKLRQAFLNLLVNAFQHCQLTERGPIRVQSIFLDVNPKRPIIVCISNPGDAIEESTRERLFEPFYTTKPEGTGLGLPIAYQTIVSNGGFLEVECEDNEIQFWVRLPREGTIARGASRFISRFNRRTPTPYA